MRIWELDPLWLSARRLPGDTNPLSILPCGRFNGRSIVDGGRVDQRRAIEIVEVGARLADRSQGRPQLTASTIQNFRCFIQFATMQQQNSKLQAAVGLLERFPRLA